jgi:hypothetical protein
MDRSRRPQKTCDRQTLQLLGAELSDDNLDKVAGGTVDVRITPVTTLHFTVLTPGKSTSFLTSELENVGLRHFSVSSGGDLPVETISLNFTKITEAFTR